MYEGEIRVTNAAEQASVDSPEVIPSPVDDSPIDEFDPSVGFPNPLEGQPPPDTP